MFTHTYPHKPLRKIKVTICNHQADIPLYVWPDVWSGDVQALKKYIHTWHWKSLLRPGVIKQHKSCTHRNQKVSYAVLTYQSVSLLFWICARLHWITNLAVIQKSEEISLWQRFGDKCRRVNLWFLQWINWETFFCNKCSKLAEHFTNCVTAMTFKTY